MTMDGDFLLFVLAGVAGITIFALAFAFAGDDAASKRLTRVKNRAGSGAGAEKVTELSLRLDNNNSGLDALVRRLLPRPELMRQRLMRTGWSISLGAYGVACAVTAVMAAAALFYFHVQLAISIPVALIVGLYLPHLVIGFAVARRSKKFTQLFPEAIGLMVRGIKSGLPIGETFLVVGQEVPDPVGEEFRRISDQARLGQTLDQALWDAAKRVDTPEIKFLVVSLSVQRETGGNLAETLENLDVILRRRRQMKLKVKAMSSEARASAAIIGAMPFIMIGVLSGVNPAYIGRLFETPLGHMMLGGGGLSMAIGIFAMQKMAKFDI